MNNKAKGNEAHISSGSHHLLGRYAAFGQAKCSFHRDCRFERVDWGARRASAGKNANSRPPGCLGSSVHKRTLRGAGLQSFTHRDFHRDLAAPLRSLPKRSEDASGAARRRSVAKNFVSRWLLVRRIGKDAALLYRRAILGRIFPSKRN